MAENGVVICKHCGEDGVLKAWFSKAGVIYR